MKVIQFQITQEFLLKKTWNIFLQIFPQKIVEIEIICIFLQKNY